MKKSVLFLLSAVSAFLTRPLSASAQLTVFGPDLNIVDLMHSIERFVGLAFGAIAVVFFVMAGIIFLTARGEPEKIKTAKAAVIWGVVGVAVGLVAFGIIALVASLLTPGSGSYSYNAAGECVINGGGSPCSP